MRSSHDKDLDKAEEALQPYYDPGDDGDTVTLALDTIAAVLGKKARISVPAKDGLIEVLTQLKAPAELKSGIEELYAAARGAEYGGGLTKKGARIVNNHVQDYAPDAIEFARTYRPRPRARVQRKRGQR